MASNRLTETLAIRYWRSLARSRLPAIVSRPAIHALARLRPRPLRGASVLEVIESLLGPMPRHEALEIARQIAINSFRNRCVRQLVLTGGPATSVPFIRSVEVDSVRRLLASGRSAILGFWHVGPLAMVFDSAFEDLGAPLLVVRTRPLPKAAQTGKGPTYLIIGDPSRRAYALKRAVEWLGKGGLVVLAVDGDKSETMIGLPFLGRTVQFSRGAAVLSRLSGAPIVPLVKTWTPDGMIDVRTFEALESPTGLSPDAADRALTQTIVQWFETFSRNSPEQIRVTALPGLWKAPPTEPANATAAWSSA